MMKQNYFYNNVSQETMNRVKKVELKWIVLDEVLLPEIKIEFEK